MADNYYGKCAMCKYFDLYDSDGYGKYKCTYSGRYYTVFEPQCTAHFEPASPTGRYSRSELVDMAREHKLP
ncbi:MAG: hypothetical protein IJ404_04985 [Clostridia bacterium]|nr:hypothetical protein [Clostridia bacterium]